MSVYIPDDSVDWILMNPPYSRTRKGQRAFDVDGLTDEERDACQKEWERAIKKEPANKRAGMAASFLVLAKKKVKPGKRIGFVLPKTVAGSDSWKKTRRMVERDFTDIIAIAVATGKARGKNALSADTKMEEMILVATRRKKGTAAAGEHSLIKCVTLHDSFTRPGEAGELARAISYAAGMVEGPKSNCPIKVGDDEVGLVNVFDAGGEGAPWGPLGVAHADLAIAADKIVDGRIEFLDKSMEMSVGMTIVKKLMKVGPSHEKIGHPEDGDGRGAFKMFEIKRPADAVGEDNAMWAANWRKQNSLVTLPTHKGRPVPGRDQEHREMRAQRSRMFYARGMQWTSQSLLVATTKHKAMGGRAWTGLNHSDIRVCKALAMWANSTLGLMVHWTQGGRTQIGRSTTQVGAIQQMPCPKMDGIGDDMLEFAADEFNRLSSRQLLPACLAHADEARWEIDRAVVKMMGLPEDANEVIDEMRLLWCQESSIHGNTQKALAALPDQDDEQS